MPDTGFMLTALEFMATLFVIAVGLVVAAVIVMYVVDVTQTRQAIRRNYPVIGRFRYVFETLGGFFRQYFFAMDREEMPFNRAERSFVYRAAKNLDNTTAFGSTRNLSPPRYRAVCQLPLPHARNRCGRSRRRDHRSGLPGTLYDAFAKSG